MSSVQMEISANTPSFGFESKTAKETETSFGVVDHYYPTDQIYEVSINENEVVHVSKNLVKADYPLLPGDHIMLKYINIHTETTDCPDKEVIELLPETSKAIGKITSATAAAILIDDTILVSPTLFSNTISANDVVEYEAIRSNDHHKYRLRAVWLRILTAAETQILFPQLDTQIEKLALAAPNKQGMVIIPDDCLTMKMDIGETQVAEIRVQNVTQRVQHHLVNLVIDQPNSGCQFRLVKPTYEQLPITLSPESSIVIEVEGKATRTGIFRANLVLYFYRMQICRGLKVVAGSEDFITKYTTNYKSLYKSHSGNTMYKLYNSRPKLNIRRTSGRENKRNQAKSKDVVNKWTVPLPVVMILKSLNWEKKFRVQNEFLFEEVTKLNYSEKFHQLLYYDEMVLFQHFLRHSKDNVLLTPCGSNYSVQIKDVAEGRPSLMKGDSVKLVNAKLNKKFTGVIIKVGCNDLEIQMEDAFGKDKEHAYDVTFYFSRGSYQKQHEAIEKVRDGLRFISLFPERINDSLFPLLDVTLQESGQLYLGNEALQLTRNDLNITQKAIIRNVLRGELRTLPYLIRGPPGTGKTTTIVEIVVQIMDHLKDSFILLCTQSNSAANLLLTKLLETGRLKSDEVIRIVSHSVFEAGGVSNELKPYCCTLLSSDDDNSDDTDGDPDMTDDSDRKSHIMFKNLREIRSGMQLEQLLSYKVVLITCGCVAQFHSLNFPKRHFTHLIVDEAAQCLETEIINPITLTEDQNSQIILAGDDKQLGPIVQWVILEECGLNLSLFERLMATPIYNRCNPGFNSVLSNELNYNYRSIPSILNIYNRFFYDSSLKGLVEVERKKYFLDMLHGILPPNEKRTKYHGVAFYSVLGENIRAANNPSWVNPEEAEVVLDIYKRLLMLGSWLNYDNIGIITPYKGQVRYIKNLIENQLMPCCKIGSVEEFQGQERDVIILSTVRSTTDLFTFDAQYNLGFICNRKRINVAVSRAQSLLIIVGNAPILANEDTWKAIIDNCTTNHNFINCQASLLESLEE